MIYYVLIAACVVVGATLAGWRLHTRKKLGVAHEAALIDNAGFDRHRETMLMHRAATLVVESMAEKYGWSARRKTIELANLTRRKMR